MEIGLVSPRAPGPCLGLTLRHKHAATPANYPPRSLSLQGRGKQTNCGCGSQGAPAPWELARGHFMDPLGVLGSQQAVGRLHGLLDARASLLGLGEKN